MGWGCHGATGDLAGDVAIETWTHDSSSGWPAEVDSGFLMRDGTASPFRGGGAPLLPLSKGFVGRVPHWPGDFPPTTFVAFSSAPLTPRVVNTEVALAADPQVGALVIDEPWNVESFWLTAHRFDGKGQLAAAPADVVEGPHAQAPRYFAAGLAHDGWGLVVFSGEPEGDAQNLYARWMDPSGRPSGEIVATHVPVGDTSWQPPFDSWSKLWLRPLFDGSLVLRVDGKWKARLARTTGSAGPAPDWLSGPDYRDLVPLPQGYALVGSGSDGDCRTVVELRAPAGNLCGSRALLDVVHADVGADGTLIVMFSHPQWKCGWRWWPALIR